MLGTEDVKVAALRIPTSGLGVTVGAMEEKLPIGEEIGNAEVRW